MSDSLKDTSGGTIAWFVRNPVAANLLMGAIIVGGILSMIRIDKKIVPEMRENTIFVEVPFPQASPEEVERGIVIKIEEAIEEVEGIKRVVSRAEENFGSVQIEVTNDYPISLVMDEVSYQVNSIFTFPERAEKPVIRRADLQEDDAIFIQISGKIDEKSMTELFEDIREEMMMVTPVSRAIIEDAREYEISIEVSEDKLRRHRLTFEEVAAAIRSYSFDLAGGTIRSDSADFRIRTRAQAYEGRDFSSIPLRRSEGGAMITVGDVANVVDGFVEDEKSPRFNGDPTISMKVKSVAGEDVLEITKAVRDFIDKKNEELPDTVKLTYWGDVSPYLMGRINLMLYNLGLGAVLVFLMLMFFLQLRLAFWVIVGIPVAFGGALFLMPMFDVTVNMISIFGFILVLGIVVDDAIVIAENIHTRVQSDGGGAGSVIGGAQEVAMPATFGVLTTIVAFIPMTQVSGSFGSIWMAIGMVVILSLTFSLVESKWILPSHLLHLKPEDYSKKPGILDRPRIAVDRGLRWFIDSVYRPLLHLALEFRYTTIALFLTMAALAIALVASGVVRFVFFPEIPSDFLIANVYMTPGTPIETTRSELRRIEDAIYQMDKDLIEKYGSPHVLHVRSRLSDRRSGEILVELTKSETRSIDAPGLAAMWHRKVGSIPEADGFTVDSSISGPGAIDIELAGRNIDDLKKAGDLLKEKLQTFDGIYNVRNSLSDGNPEVLLALRPEAEARGLTLASVATQVRQGFYGNEAQRIQRSTNEIKVMVRYPKDERGSLHHLNQIRLRTPDGDEIPFSSAVDVKFEEGYASLQRADGLRVARITAAAEKNIAEPGKIAGELLETFPEEVLNKQFPNILMRLAGQSEQEQESLQELLVGFVFAILCIYGLMAIPLKSYIQPLLIMTGIPFGFIGAVIGHILLGLPFSVLSLCGIIALAGVVVNDSIVFVDYVNRQRAKGLSAIDAAKEAGPARFRAIMLTSLTTFIGLIPIIAERSLQAQIVIPMAVTLAFGILFATLITLFLLPTLYLVPVDVRNLFVGKNATQQQTG